MKAIVPPRGVLEIFAVCLLGGTVPALLEAGPSQAEPWLVAPADAGRARRQVRPRSEAGSASEVSPAAPAAAPPAAESKKDPPARHAAGGGPSGLPPAVFVRSRW